MFAKRHGARKNLLDISKLKFRRYSKPHNCIFEQLFARKQAFVKHLCSLQFLLKLKKN